MDISKNLGCRAAVGGGAVRAVSARAALCRHELGWSRSPGARLILRIERRAQKARQAVLGAPIEKGGG
jgi:hypothetical protein